MVVVVWGNKGSNGGKLNESDGSRWWMLIGCETATSLTDWLRPNANLVIFACSSGMCFASFLQVSTNR